MDLSSFPKFFQGVFPWIVPRSNCLLHKIENPLSLDLHLAVFFLPLQKKSSSCSLLLPLVVIFFTSIITKPSVTNHCASPSLCVTYRHHPLLFLHQPLLFRFAGASPPSLQIPCGEPPIVARSRQSSQTLQLPLATVPLQLHRPVAADCCRSVAVSCRPFLFSFAAICNHKL